ncbi:MAG: DinB family protein [Segetibacter sp.]
MSTDTKSITKQLTDLITKGNAHVTFEQAVENISFKNIGVKPNNLPYSIWMLAEHIRIAQADILDFSINSDYKELKWPEEYWPTDEMPKDEIEWQKCLDQILLGRNQFIDLLSQPGVDLFKPFPHGNGQNLLREALLIADHNSYHTGEIVLIRRLLNDWNS